MIPPFEPPFEQPDEHHEDYRVDDILHAARVIRRAKSVADIASGVLRAVVNSLPGDSREWHARGVVRSAVECRLHRLELLLVQRMASSPELASDMRLEAKRNIARLLSTLEAGPDLCEHVAELAVSAIAGLATASDAVTRALAETGRSAATRPVAFATMGGRLFIPAITHEFANEHGLTDSELDEVLLRTTKPLREACESHDVCRIGQLRFKRELPAQGLTVLAQLDTSTDANAAPLIRIDLTRTAAQPESTAAYSAPEPCTNRYSARLLRQLVG